MPLWTIYHPTSTFNSTAIRASFASEVTNIYTVVPLPAFYVNVMFQPIDPTNYFVGGVARPSLPNNETPEPGPDSSRPFIRITIQNIARKLPDQENRDRFMDKVDKAIKPFIEDMGYDWEYNIQETSRDLWKIQGLVPPMPGTEAEKEWVKWNKPVPFEKENGGLA